jgi:hypothetical protein
MKQPEAASGKRTTAQSRALQPALHSREVLFDLPVITSHRIARRKTAQACVCHPERLE